MTVGGLKGTKIRKGRTTAINKDLVTDVQTSRTMKGPPQRDQGSPGQPLHGRNDSYPTTAKKEHEQLSSSDFSMKIQLQG